MVSYKHGCTPSEIHPGRCAECAEPLEPAEDAPTLVDAEHGCPNCHERDVDRLVWIEDEVVECHTCGANYNPLEK